MTLVDRGVQEARRLDREPRVQAELYQTLGGIYQLGNLDQADTLLQPSLDQRRSLLPSNTPEIARGVTALALLRSDQARFDEAEQLARKGSLPPSDAPIRRPAGRRGDRGGRPGSGTARRVRPGDRDARGSRDAAIDAGADPSDLAAAFTNWRMPISMRATWTMSESLNQRS